MSGCCGAAIPTAADIKAIVAQCVTDLGLQVGPDGDINDVIVGAPDPVTGLVTLTFVFEDGSPSVTVDVCPTCGDPATLTDNGDQTATYIGVDDTGAPATCILPTNRLVWDPVTCTMTELDKTGTATGVVLQEPGFVGCGQVRIRARTATVSLLADPSPGPGDFYVEQAADITNPDPKNWACALLNFNHQVRVNANIDGQPFGAGGLAYFDCGDGTMAIFDGGQVFFGASGNNQTPFVDDPDVPGPETLAAQSFLNASFTCCSVPIPPGGTITVRVGADLNVPAVYADKILTHVNPLLRDQTDMYITKVVSSPNFAPDPLAVAL